MSAITKKRMYWFGLVAGTLLAGILPGGCETVILRAVTPFLLT